MRNWCLPAASVAAAILIISNASAATLRIPLVPAEPAVQTLATMEMEVAHSYANLREKPTTHSKLLAKLNHGTKVEVIEKVAGGKWTHVKVNGMEGYISTNLLK